MGERALHRRATSLPLFAALALATPACTDEPPPDTSLGTLRLLELHKAAGGYHAHEETDWRLLIRSDGKAELHDSKAGTVATTELAPEQFDALAELSEEAHLARLRRDYVNFRGHRDMIAYIAYSLRAQYSGGQVEVRFTARDGPPELHALRKGLEMAKESASWHTSR